MFVERRVSALPVVDENNKLVDIYAKFDVIVSIKPCAKASTDIGPYSRKRTNIIPVLNFD